MKNKLFFILGGVALFAVVFAKNVENSTNEPVSIQSGDNNPVFIRTQDLDINQSREEIDLIVDDFEGDVSGWNVSDGWQLTEDSYNSETHSFWSPDELFFDDNVDPSYKSWDLYSPTYTLPLLGDGESAEGAVWEAAQVAVYHKLESLCAVVDVNGFGQSDQTRCAHDLEALAQSWRGFGWNALVVDGHEVQALLSAYNEARTSTGRPTVILARTLKGKGVQVDVEGVRVQKRRKKKSGD